MRLIRGEADRGPVLASAFLLGALLVLAATVMTGAGARVTAPTVAVICLVIVAYRKTLTWRNLVAGLIAVILVIPIGRYTLPGSLPFQLEPYRLVVAFIVLGWFASLLVDPRVRLRRTLFDGPLLLIAFSTLMSVVVNGGRVQSLGVQATVVKRLTFFASFLVLLFLISSVVHRRRDVDYLLRILVGGGVVIAAFSLVEFSTGYNVFNHIGGPILHEQPLPYSLGQRGDRLRVYASAQHPIALGAAFVMLIPLAVYLWQSSRSRLWAGAIVLLLLGMVATESRTAIVMGAVVVLFYLRLRPQQTKRLWPALLPLLLVIHFALPGSVSGLKGAFFPEGGLVAQQDSGKGTYGSGRLADLGPAVSEWGQQPIFGEGYGTRITDKGPQQNAQILDDQWLGTLLETGVVGALGFAWLFLRCLRRLTRVAREEPGPTGWLCTGLAASIAAFAVGMLTYDAFSFIQVTFLLFILLALASAVLTYVERESAPSPTGA
jgi:hypothetical protein